MMSPQIILSKNDRRAFNITAPPNASTQPCTEKTSTLHGHTISIQGRNKFTVHTPTRYRYLTIGRASLGTDYAKVKKAAENWKSNRRCVLQVHGADIRLEPLALHPNDKLEPWFDAVASKVVTRESRFKWSRNLNNVRLHKAKVVRAITLLTIVLKVRGDMQGTATVFAYAPEIIAGDLRSNKLAEVFGTDTIRYLLEDIFLQIKTSSDAPAPQPLLSAARDLIVAYLARQDHHSLVHTDPEAVSRKLSHLFAFLDNTDGGEQPSFRLLAIKTGITYAAIVCTAYDMAQENEHNRGVFGADVQGVGMVVKAAVGMTPVGGSVASSAVEGAHNIIWDITDPKLKEHDTARNLVDDALDDFNSSIIYNANKGYILMRSTMTTPQVNAEDAKEYAITSTDYLKMLVQGVSLTAGQAKV